MAISPTSERVETSAGSDYDPGRDESGEPDPAASGEAQRTSRQADRITICHRTNSDANPYVRVTVSERALRAHFEHTEDIIPRTESHPGQNWPSKIWDAGCVLEEPTPAETATPVPTVETSPEPTVTPEESPEKPTPAETATPVPTVTPEKPTPAETATPVPTVEATPGPPDGAVKPSEDSAASATATPVVATPSPAPSSPAPSDLGGGGAGDELAETGASSSALGLIAALLMVAGAAMIAVARRLATSADIG